MSEKMQGSILRRKILWNNYLNFADRFLRRTRNTDTSLRSQRFMKRLKDTKATQEMLKSSVLSNDPFLLLRFGLYEYQLCYQYLEKLNGVRSAYSGFLREHIHMDAGIIADGDTGLDSYAQFIIENLYDADIIAYWRNYPEI